MAPYILLDYSLDAISEDDTGLHIAIYSVNLFVSIPLLLILY